MLINQSNENNFTADIAIDICDFHNKNPNTPYAGCTCCANIAWREKTQEEREMKLEELNAGL